MLSKKLFLSSAAFFVLVSLPFVGSVGASSEMWSQTYGGTADEKGYSLVATSDGGFALAGETGSFGAGDSDFWLVKTDEYGIIPEFPSWIIIPLFLTATLAAIFYSKRVRARLRHF